MPSIKNIQISLIDDGKKFTSLESPLVYSDALKNSDVNVTVIAPFHSNVHPNQHPTITVSTDQEGNNVLIEPAFNASMPLSDIYTQVVKIDFGIDNPMVAKDGTAPITVTVDEKGKPDKHTEPKRKTKIIVPPQN